MKQDLTHDTLPKGVTLLIREFDNLKRFLLEQAELSITEQPDRWFNLEELLEYDPANRSKATWYSKVSRREVPFHKNGKNLIFLKSEIDAWLKEGKCKTSSEIEAETDAYLFNKKKGLKK